MQNIKSFNESKTPKAGFLGGVICLGISLLSFAAPSFAQDKSGTKSSYTKLEKPSGYEIVEVIKNQDVVFNCLAPQILEDGYPIPTSSLVEKYNFYREIKGFKEGNVLLYNAELYNLKTKKVRFSQYVILPSTDLSIEDLSIFHHPSGVIFSQFMSLLHPRELKNISEFCDPVSLIKITRGLKQRTAQINNPKIEEVKPNVSSNLIDTNSETTESERKQMIELVKTGKWVFHQLKDDWLLINFSKRSAYNPGIILASDPVMQRTLLNIPDFQLVPINEVLKFYPFSPDGEKTQTGINLTPALRSLTSTKPSP